jgi:hypothetical protein
VARRSAETPTESWLAPPEKNMTRFRPYAALVLVLPVLALPVLALPVLTFPWISAAKADDCAPADATLAGHYYLHGVMEVGSELLLLPNGRFDYMLAYGALDELASGCWSREGGSVTLVASKFETSMEDEGKFDRLELKILPGGKLERRFDAGHVGKYSR